MKKKRIELNQKLFLNKERIASLSNSGSVLGGGGITGDENCIRPIGGGSVQQVAVSQDWIGGCQVAASLAMNACQASGMAVCISLQKGNCGTIISAAGNVC